MADKRKKHRRRDGGSRQGRDAAAHAPQHPAKATSHRFIGWVVVVAVIGLAGAGWYVFAGRGAPRDTLNVILISMDTTRADRLGCYDYPDAGTPNIDGVAREGAVFTQCTAPAPLTLPSHATMMTGTEPYVHGARMNAQFKLHPDNVTLAEVLRGAGFATEAETAAIVLNAEFGLDQGFDVYRDVQAVNRTRPNAAQQPLVRLAAADVGSAAVKALRHHADERFFLFVHFFDAHLPYKLPRRIRARFKDSYQAAIVTVDEQIGRLLTELRRLKLDRKTLVIITADHGEGLGQHDEDSHGAFVYDSTLTVPLIMRCPGWIPAGSRIDAQVRLIDLAPTIVDLLGTGAMAEAQGTSLMPLIRRETDDPHLSAYAESMGAKYDYGYAPLRALRQNGWKYIHGPRPELYHVAQDPDEQHDLAADQPDRVLAMQSALKTLMAQAPPGVGTERARKAVSAQTTAQMQSLGYVGEESSTEGLPRTGQREVDFFEPTGLNPMDHAEEIRFINRCIDLLRQGKFAEIEQQVRAFLASVDRTEGLHRVYQIMAAALDAQGKIDEAIEFHRKVVAANPNDGLVLTDLGSELVRAGSVDEAIAVFEEALTKPVVFARTEMHLADMLRRVNRENEAVQHYEAALKLDPGLAEAHAVLGDILIRQGRASEALDHYRQASALVPKNLTYRAMVQRLRASTSQGSP